MSYDQWKTASPYDDAMPDDICYNCGGKINMDNIILGTEPEYDGFCCEECRQGAYKHDMPKAMYDLLSQDLGDNPDRWDRAIYKGTDCGAWMRINRDGDSWPEIYVSIGSIVEGSDAEVTAEDLVWPFTRDQFWETVEWVNQEASMLWDEANQFSGDCDETDQYRS